MLELASVTCPYCWERFEVEVDLSAGDQELVEDCAVCCQPVTLAIRVGPDGTLAGLDAARENG